MKNQNQKIKKINQKNLELKNKMMKNSMIPFGLILTGILTLESCGLNNTKNNDNPAPINSEQNSSETTNRVDPNSSPESVMNSIFHAAKTGEVEILKFLFDSF